jgi:ribosomal protein L11 methylase PrmA
MTDIIWLILYFVIGITLAGLLFFGLIFGAMYTRIPTKKLKKAIELGDLNGKKTVYDLGAGLGTISFEAAYTGAKIYAIEVDPIKIACMKFLLKYNNYLAKAQMFAPKSPMKHTPYLFVEIKRANLLKTDIHQADVVYCYLSPALMPKVGAKAKAEMKQGKKLISIEYPIKGWTPSFADEESKIYVYTIGEA